jgi:hypothetical protein
MTQETLEQIINTLQEGEIPLEKLEEIDQIIDQFETTLQLMRTARSRIPIPLSGLSLSAHQNKQADILIQTLILEQLRSSLSPLKTQEIAIRLQEQIKKIISIRGILQQMHKNGKIKLLKVNQSNKRSYWILPEWYDPHTQLPITDKGIQWQVAIDSMKGVTIT